MAGRERLTVSVEEYGATPDTLCTGAIQNAIDAAAAAGGTVVFPAGRWISGTLILRSNLTVLLGPQTVLQASPDIAQYPAYRASVHEGQRYHFLIGDSARNILITGGGTIDGSFDAFQKLCGDPPNYWCELIDKAPETLLEFRHCQRLVLDGITIARSPCCSVHAYCCDDVTIRGLRVDNHVLGAGTDGVDINGSRNVFIADTKISTGRDGIVIKASAGSRMAEHITVTNCVVRAGGVGIGIGPQAGEGVSQVAVSNCVLCNCHRMIAVATYQGGLISDVAFSAIVGDTLVNNLHPLPLHVDVKQHPSKRFAGGLGSVRNLMVSSLIARTTGRVLMTAQQGAWIDNATLRDIRLDCPDLQDPEHLLSPDGRDWDDQYSNFNLEARRQRAACIVENARDLVIEGFTVSWPRADAPVLPAAAKWAHYRQDRHAFAGLWARHVRGGLIDVPLLTACRSGTPLVLDDVDALIRAR